MSWTDVITVPLPGLGTIRFELIDPVLIGGVGLVIGLVLYALRGERGSKLACRWRRAGGDRGKPYTKWACQTCGVIALSTTRRHPDECRKPVRLPV